jgi:nucleoside diphosphate kinase
LILEKPAAVLSFRKLVGPTEPAIAKIQKPHTLRATFGAGQLPANAVHGSDATPGAVDREIQLFFPKVTLKPLAVKKK